MDEQHRGSAEKIRGAVIDTPLGAKVELGWLAEIAEDRGPNTISREKVQRKIVVQSNVSGRDVASVVEEFRERFYDTELFYDKYAGGKFAHYLFRRHGSSSQAQTQDHARTLVEETQLFIEAAHACYERIARLQVAAASASE